MDYRRGLEVVRLGGDAGGVITNAADVIALTSVVEPASGPGGGPAAYGALALLALVLLRPLGRRARRH